MNCSDVFERTGVARIDPPLADGMYESALVLGLPGSLVEQIESIRRAFDTNAPPDHQLVPHLTILYLGEMSSARLESLHHALGQLGPISVDVSLGEMGTFQARGRVTNVHLRAAPEAALRQLHLRALEICAACGWPPQTPFVADRYVPHVSVLDRIDVPAEQLALDSMDGLPAPARLSDLHLIGKRIKTQPPGGAAGPSPGGGPP